MLATYLITLAVGGVMLTLAMFGGDAGDGGHGGADHGGTGNGNGHGGGNGHGVATDHGGALDLVLGWLPVTSLRFWIIFAAFFGLTGTALTLGGFVGAEPVPLVLSIAVGWASGVMVVSSIRKLTRGEVSSGVASRDLIGATATVLVPLRRGAGGKVRVRMKDRAVDLMATTDDEGDFAEGNEVVVYEVVAGGGVVVTRGVGDPARR
jgi:hypothetical protein